MYEYDLLEEAYGQQIFYIDFIHQYATFIQNFPDWTSFYEVNPLNGCQYGFKDDSYRKRFNQFATQKHLCVDLTILRIGE